MSQRIECLTGVFDSLTSVVTQGLAVVLPSPSPLDSLSSQTKCNTLLILFSRQGLEDKAKQRLASILLKGFDRARSLQLAGAHQFLEFYRKCVSKNSSI